MTVLSSGYGNETVKHGLRCARYVFRRAEQPLRSATYSGTFYVLVVFLYYHIVVFPKMEWSFGKSSYRMTGN